MNLLQRLVFSFVVCIPSSCWAESAESILASTGVRGGLIVHVGCAGGKLTAALCAGDGYLVQGLDANPANVARAREYVKSLGKYGTVSIDRLSGSWLPYTDDLVNLLVSEDLGAVSMGEVMRVLRPSGVAYIKAGGKWRKTVKPHPRDIDEWTHFLHGPDNNAVAHDQEVGVPRHLRWLGRPKFARAHEQLASLGACVTTAGRLFYIVDEAPRSDVRFSSKWVLVARDAFNGVVLWKRPVRSWVDQFRRFRSGPAETSFRMAAKDDLVYVTLGIDAPVSILDAVTGRTLATCEGTAGARQILRIGDRLVILVDTRPETTAETDSMIRRGLKPAPGVRAIVAADATSGKKLWRKEISEFVHPTLAAQGDCLFYQTNQDLFRVDLDSGKQRWQAEQQPQLKGHELGWESPTLVVHGPTVYSADFKRIVAYSVKDGAILWQGPSQSGYNSPPDLFLIGDTVWMRNKAMIGLDAATGKVKKQIPTVAGYMHHRCYRNKATDQFALLGIQGVQFVDLESDDVWPNHWIRGTCQYGIMPANGLLYVTPDSCACNLKSKLAGLWALAADPAVISPHPSKDAPRLEKGPAFGMALEPPTATKSKQAWPVYRHDFARSGVTKTRVPVALAPAWQIKIGGRLTGVTIADDKLFVASIDTHTVHAVDARSGKSVWTYTAGGRVDSPPTIWRGLAIFGSADGWIHALRAEDGELAWRFRAAPEDKRTFVNGQLESVWPAHGSVLIHQGKLVVTAGRSSYLDGGIRVCVLEPESGELVSETTIYSPDPETGKQPTDSERKDVRGALTDILLANGDDIYMRHVKLDLENGGETGRGVHLFSPTGLLDDTWWHRTYWVISDQFIAHWSGWWKVGNWVPSGRIMSYDEQSVFGYGRDKYVSGNTGQWRGGERYQLFACDRPAADQLSKLVAARGAARRGRKRGKNQGKKQPAKSKERISDLPSNRWATRTPFHVRAMVVADKTMFIAGPPERIEVKGTGEDALKLLDPEQAVAAWQGKLGAVLWAVSTRDGKQLAQYELDAPPVFDGMAAANGRLYLAKTNGTVVCFEPAAAGK